METLYEFSPADQIIMMAAIVHLQDDLENRDVSDIKRNNINALKAKLKFKMSNSDLRLTTYYLPATFPKNNRTEEQESTFTCGWCKERIDSNKMSAHIKGCRVTIDDVKADLSNWLEE